jgi:outer membrane receptor protein involved in Fe transport
VPGATITVTNLGTQRVVTVSSGGDGNFVIAALPPGRYRVEVQQTGFKSSTRDITLQTEQVAALDVQLQVGQASEKVEVTGDVPVVESATSNISEVVTGKQITQLPLNGRNFTQLATLIPGVSRGKVDGQATGSGNQAETFRYNNTGGGSLSVNGLRPQNNNFMLDGIDNNESLVNTIIFFTPAEALQEFRVDTSIAPAEVGRAGGGVVNTSSKSGSNDIHGSAFEFLRNSALDANTAYFNPLTNGKPTPKAPFKRNQFGGTIGGPILKNKLFFFGDYQGLRQSLPLGLEEATVPTDKMRAGDFSELLTLATPVQLKDPITGMPLAGNLIPSTEIIAPGQNYLKAFPEPNLTGAAALCAQANLQGVCIQKNFVTQRQNIQKFDDFDVRSDWNITPTDTLFGRYSYAKDNETTTSRLPTLPAGFGSGDQFASAKSFALGETHTFKSNLLNEFRFGWIRSRLGYTPPFEGVPLSKNLGIPNANTSAQLGGGALIGGNNNQIEYTGDYGPYLVPEQTWQINDSLSWIKGSHTLKFGANLIDRQVNLFRPFAGKGFFNLWGDGGGQSPTGYEVSDLLAGFVHNYFVGPALGFSHTRNWETGYYAQDDWKATRHLTLNLGVRYDLYTWPSETNNLQANFDIATGQLVLPGTNGYPKSLINTDTNNFAPRIGFAYSPTSDGRTVVRGGYGIFYFLDRGGIDNQLAQNPPFSGQSQFQYENGFRINLGGEAPNNTNNPTAVDPNGLPGKGPLNVNLSSPANVSVIAYPKNNVTSYAEQWNLQVQRQLDVNTSFSLAYVGSAGIDLTSLFNYNRQTYDAASGVRPFTNLGNVNLNITNGTSHYNGLQAQLQRRLSRGVQFNASYSWSHTIDDSPGTLDTQSDHVDLFNFRHERANSLLDIRHRFVLNAIFELPFGHGKPWGNSFNGVEQAVLGGWELLPILTLQSGMPFDINDSKNQPNTRPDLIGSLQQINHLKTWFDTAAFVDPASVGGVYVAPGTAPRDPFTGPARKFLDLTIEKNFKITERVNTEFRTAFYNITNSPQFSAPSGDINNGDFGKVTGIVLSSERQIEFALRFSF